GGHAAAWGVRISVAPVSRVHHRTLVCRHLAVLSRAPDPSVLRPADPHGDGPPGEGSPRPPPWGTARPRVDSGPDGGEDRRMRSAVGVDLGGTKVQAVALAASGAVLGQARGRTPTSGAGDAGGGA